jgi:hypothetical protein
VHEFGVVTVLCVQGGQVLLQPPRSELRYVFEHPWLLEEVHGTRDDLQSFLTVVPQISFEAMCP